MPFFFVCLLNIKVAKERTLLLTSVKYVIVKFFHLIKEMNFGVGFNWVLRFPKLAPTHISRKGILYVVLNLAFSLIKVLYIVKQVLTLWKGVNRV